MLELTLEGEPDAFFQVALASTLGWIDPSSYTQAELVGLLGSDQQYMMDSGRLDAIGRFSECASRDPNSDPMRPLLFQAWTSKTGPPGAVRFSNIALFVPVVRSDGVTSATVEQRPSGNR
jgi:hypothetical protein